MFIAAIATIDNPESRSHLERPRIILNDKVSIVLSVREVEKGNNGVKARMVTRRPAWLNLEPKTQSPERTVRRYLRREPPSKLGPNTAFELCRKHAWKELEHLCHMYPEYIRPRLASVETNVESRPTGFDAPTIQERHATFYPTVLGMICSSDLSGTPRHLLLQTVETILSVSPHQIRCSQVRHGHTPLRDSLRNASCPPCLVELLLRFDQCLGRTDDSALLQVDEDGLFPIEHILYEIHLGASPDALSKLQILLKFSDPESEDGSHSSHESFLLRLLCLGSSSPGKLGSVPKATCFLHALHGAVQLLLNHQPEDLASQRTRLTECTPLHVALQNFGNFTPIVNSLLHHDRQATCSMVAAQNVYGDLPIHVACRTGAPPDVLKLVLEHTVNACSEELMSGSLHHPLVWSTNHADYTPFDLLWLKYFETRTRAVTFNGREEFSPEDSAGWRRRTLYFSLLDKTLSQITSGDDGKDPIPDSRTRASEQQLGALQQNMFLLITAACKGSPVGKNDDFLLHKVSSLSGLAGPRVPLPIMKLFLWQFPQQICSRDASGKFPLHYAVGMRKVNADISSKARSSDWTEWVDLLCHRYPEGCRVRDVNGQLPLHHAIKTTASLGDDNTTIETLNKGVRNLLSTYSEASASQDPCSGFYPAFLAASNPKISLWTIYELVRRSPHLLQFVTEERNAVDPFK